MNNLPVGIRGKRRAIQDGIDEVAVAIFLSPPLWYDMMIIKITILRHVAGHPVARALNDEQIKNTIVD
jgi:hypothetical protein